MGWTPWIKIENEDSADESVRQLFKETRNAITGEISDLTRLTSLTPEISSRLNSLRSAVYRHPSRLTAREKEIVALVTSSFIGCVH